MGRIGPMEEEEVSWAFGYAQSTARCTGEGESWMAERSLQRKH